MWVIQYTAVGMIVVAPTVSELFGGTLTVYATREGKKKKKSRRDKGEERE